MWFWRSVLQARLGKIPEVTAAAAGSFLAPVTFALQSESNSQERSSTIMPTTLRNVAKANQATHGFNRVSLLHEVHLDCMVSHN